MKRRVSLLLHLLAAVCAAATPASEFDPKPALRVLRDECIGCHKPGKAKGGLLLINREKMLAGGENGVVVVPGKAAESPLHQLLLADADPHMPPKKDLPAESIEVIRRWIDSGAPWDASVFDEPPAPRTVQLAPLPNAYQPALALALSPDEKQLAVTRGGGWILRDLSKDDRPITRSVMAHPAAIESLAWTPDGQRLVTGGFQKLIVWNVLDGKEIGRLEKDLIGPITALTITPDGKTLFAADGETGGAGFIHRLSLPDLRILKTWKAHDDGVLGLRLSNDGQWLATSGADRMARLWKVADATMSAFFEGHTNHVLSVAFDADAQRIATAGADREVKVWDIATREQDAILGDKKTAFSALAWTPDGKALVAVTEKGTGSIYTELSKHTGESRSTTAKERKLTGVDAPLTSVAVTRDGKTVYASGFDGRVFVWEASSGKVLAEIATDSSSQDAR